MWEICGWGERSGVNEKILSYEREFHKIHINRGRGRIIQPLEWCVLTERINAVVNCTLIHVKNKAKLTNLMKISRIEGYNGK